MIVYVETNFILELALEQEQHKERPLLSVHKNRAKVLQLYIYPGIRGRPGLYRKRTRKSRVTQLLPGLLY